MTKDWLKWLVCQMIGAGCLLGKQRLGYNSKSFFKKNNKMTWFANSVAVSTDFESVQCIISQLFAVLVSKVGRQYVSSLIE